jgi:ATP-binding cassette, subfamily B, multidrug efflux pump
MRAIWRVVKYMRSFWIPEVAAYLAMLGISGIDLWRPLIFRRVIDVGITLGDVNVLMQSVLLLLGLTIIRGVFRFGEGYLAERVSQGIAYIMRNELYQKLQSLSFSYHDQTQTGQLLSRATSDVERLQRITGRGIIALMQALVLLIGTTIILVRMQPFLAVLSLACMPIVVLFMKQYVDRMHPLWHERQDRMAELISRLEQNLQGVSVVRGFAQEDAEIERFEDENRNIFEIAMALTRAQSFRMPFIILLASVSTVLILWLGGRMVVLGQLTLGELVAFNSYLLQLINPIRRLGFMITMLGESGASAERVFEILDAKSQVEDQPGAVDMGEIAGAVDFQNVSFAYVSDNNVLSDVSFHVDPGQIVALLGPTGSGKSTIINLIPRFYDISEGCIKIDELDIREVTLDSLRNQIGIVLQETMLFGSTIRENITFGRPEATQDEIEEAARAAAAHDFITRFPQGYDTPVGERGVTLSGGQRQRVAIARALLLDPKILILDDATSSVDTETEREIQNALQRLMRGRTSFVIAQRVSTVRNADIILVIDRGKLVARGKHEELIRESGIYAEIYYRQLRHENGQPLSPRATAALAGS